MRTEKRLLPNLPEVRPGNWQGEIPDGYTVSLGQVVQDGPPRRSVEFLTSLRQQSLPHLTCNLDGPASS